jgi:hypothetical protein
VVVAAHDRGRQAGQRGPGVIDALRRFAPAYVQQQRLSASTRSTLETLLRCRTAALGGHRYDCDDCGYTAVLYNSCGNRHCPQCQGARRRRWVEAQERLLLPVPHFQVVFTLPAELRPIAREFPREVYDLLFQAAHQTLRKLAATKWRATPAILMVLHTWARNLSFHPHVHCVVSSGGLDEDDAWVSSGRDFLFAVAALQRLFRGLFLSGLTRLGLDLDRSQRVRLRNARRRAALKSWNVFVGRARSRDAMQMVKYLAQYAYQTAISDHRIVAVREDTVTFRTRGADTVTLPGREFVRRFALHVLPRRFRKIRHYALLAPGARPRLAAARALVAHLPRVDKAHPQPIPEDPAITTAVADSFPTRRCPCCGAPLRLFLLPAAPTGPWPRGPP